MINKIIRIIAQLKRRFVLKPVAVIVPVLTVGLVSAAGVAMAQTYYATGYAAPVTSSFTSEMGVGSQSAEVTKLQTFLASNRHVYPQGLVTGYYGPLTQAAVRNYQIGYGIEAVGRFGPQTMASANSLVQRNLPVDVSSPTVSTPAVSISGRNATIAWNTDEAATAKVHYSTTPITASEVASSKMEPYISGSVAEEAVLTTGHSITLSNLTPNTTYYYRTESIDNQGNVTVTEQQTFNSGQ